MIKLGDIVLGYYSASCQEVAIRYCALDNGFTVDYVESNCTIEEVK